MGVFASVWIGSASHSRIPIVRAEVRILKDLILNVGNDSTGFKSTGDVLLERHIRCRG